MATATFKINDIQIHSMKKIATLPEGAQATPFKGGTLDIRERQDLQECMANQFDAIFNEGLGQNLLFIDSEKEMGDSENRFDILAMNAKGELIVLELKRGDKKAKILTQAMGYAGILSQLGSGEEALRGLSENDQERVRLFLKQNGTPIEQFNCQQRVMLVAEGFDIKIRGAIHWLNSFTGMFDLMDQYITALNVTLHQNGPEHFFTFEFEDLDMPEVNGSIAGQAKDNLTITMEERLSRIQNEAAKSFWTKYIGTETFRDQYYYFRRLGKRTWRARLGKKHVSIRQYASTRFEGDIAYWTSNISSETVNTTKKGITFNLKTLEDFEAFEAGMAAEHKWL